MNVLVTGGDGFVGRHLCTELIERDHDVTSLSRNPDPSALPEGVETATGDVTDGEGITHAFEGIDAVVNLVALSPLFTPSGGDEMHERIHLGGTENVVAAAEAHDVDRVVQMSALGADPHGPTHYIRAKGQAEEVVRESDLQSVIVRPSVIFGDGGEFVSFTKRLKKLFAPGIPVYPLPGGGKKTRFQPIWVGDLAPMLASTVEDDDRAGETYELGGPEILTLREVTEAVYESEGRSIKIVSLPMGLAGIGLKTLSVVPGFPMGGDQYRSLQFDNTTDDNDVGAFDVDTDELTSLREYLGSA